MVVETTMVSEEILTAQLTERLKEQGD